MSFTFQIRPLGMDSGYELQCEGIFADPVHHSRLIEAIIHAVHVGHQLDGQIEIYDCDGVVVEILPVGVAVATAETQHPHQHAA